MNEGQKATPAKHQVTNPKLLLWVLMIVYVLNFLDRQIVNILAEPISRDLGLSDTQIGADWPCFRAFLHASGHSDCALCR